MKSSIRTRFTLGMIFLFLIILVLSVFSGYYLNKLSAKTGAILEENYLSVVYAREMSEGLRHINQEIMTNNLLESNSDSLMIKGELHEIEKSLLAAKNNITETGEDSLISCLESGYAEYRKLVLWITKSPKAETNLLLLLKESNVLNGQLLLLSEMNGKAIEAKTDDARTSSKNALAKMSVLATLCFLIGFSFTFSFAAYFNRRFFQLYEEIKDIVSINVDKPLVFEGKDEFDGISMAINEMAERLNNKKPKISVALHEGTEKISYSADVEELKKMLFRIKTLEEQAAALISRIEKK